MTKDNPEPTELDELVLFMATLGWIYGKYDDQCFHIFDSSGNNTMTIDTAKSLYALINKSYISRKAVDEAIGEDEYDNYVDEYVRILAKVRDELRADIKKRLLEEK